MAIRFRLPAGEIVETDTVNEAKQMAAALNINYTKAQPTNNFQGAKANINNNSVPSIDDFRMAYKEPQLKKLLDFVKQKGTSLIISDNDFKQNTGKKSLSGLGQIFKKATGGACLAQLIKKNSIKNIYEVDKSAYNNLIQA